MAQLRQQHPLFQFTPLREGRPADGAAPSAASIISIHAPPRGATKSTGSGRARFPFQFTPLREGRLPPATPRWQAEYFNSRPSARGDEIAEKQDMSAGISIHAPPRGATLTSKGMQEKLAISIHAPPRGATDFHGCPCRLFCYFNSRPSARGDIAAEAATVRPYYFNSRPSARGDAAEKVAVNALSGISIHAPPRGATFLPNKKISRGAYFNSRPSARGDGIAESEPRRLAISIHAPPRGATIST